MEGLILLRKQPASIKLDTKFYFLQALAVQPQKFLFIPVAEPSRFHSRRREVFKHCKQLTFIERQPSQLVILSGDDFCRRSRRIST